MAGNARTLFLLRRDSVSGAASGCSSFPLSHMRSVGGVVSVVSKHGPGFS
jgi:hypothetical protein